MRFADVVVDISLEKLDKTYQYAIPDHLSETAVIGAKVEVPFGNRKLTGYILDISDTPAFAPEKTKEILNVVPGAIGLEKRSISLAYWMKEYFGGTMNEALKTVLPVKQAVRSQNKKTLRVISTEKLLEYQKVAVQKKYVARQHLCEVFLEHPGLDSSEAVNRYGVSQSAITTALRDEILLCEEERTYRNPAKISGNVEKPVLNEQQSEAVKKVSEAMEQNNPHPFLLFGVTGSGKTEVYLELIEKTIQSGKQAIVLIPEIALTFQTIRRFTERFGERVSILHSRLSKGERYDQYVRAANGEIDIMIGPRSALFTPFENPGLIIIDEEQENAYKSENTPKYHARETAEYLAKETGAILLLGSATPSLEAFSKVKKGEYELLRLTKRAKNATMPTVTVVDLRDELQSGNRSIFSRTLKEQIKERLAKNEQIMLFLNRRGYAGAVSCRACGEAIKCPHCDITLTLHKGGTLLCHYCGYSIAQPKSCPSCNSKYIGLFGTGTQKVEEAFLREFPGTTVLRMDADTTKNKGDHERIVRAFAEEKAQVLIGTQMIVKGHDFPKVTLVGILAADLSLHAGDYRAAERTFDLLAQAAGRAGRDKLPGSVVIQTYQPDHYSILTAAREDYEGFYREEMTFRKIMGYPPAAHMLVTLVQGEEEAKTKECAGKMAKILKDLLGNGQKPGTIGNAIPSGIVKINDVYRYTVVVKGVDYETLRTLHKNAQESKRILEDQTGCRILFDFDPYSGY